MKLGSKHSLLVACVLVATASTAMAAIPSQAVPTVEPVTVTATRTEQLVKEVPTTTYVISSQDIQEREYKDLQAALMSVPGLQFSTDPHGGINVTIRGAEARHTLILIDGQRVPTELTKARANFASYKRINMNNVERIEIIQGASSAIYGSEAIGGVINIITKDYDQETGNVNLEVQKRHHSDGTGYTAGIGYSSGWKNNFKLDLYAEKNKRISTERDGKTATFEGPRTPLHGSLAYKFTPNDKVTLSYDHVKEELTQAGFGGGPNPFAEKDITSKIFTVQYDGTHGATNSMVRFYQSDYKDHYVNTYKMMFNGPGGHPGSGKPGDKPGTGHPGANPGGGHSGGGHSGGHPGADAGGHGKPTPGVSPIMGPDGKPIGISIHKWDRTHRTDRVLEGQVSTALNPNHLLTYGAVFKKETGIGTRVNTKDVEWTKTEFGVTHTAYKGGMSYRNFFVQDEWTVSDKLLLVPALRLDTSDKFDNRLSPKLGLTYKIAPDFRVKANVGTGYSLPGFTELYHEWEMFGPRGGENGFYWRGNPDLKPETSKNFDISLEKEFKNGHAKVTYFHNKIEDYIEGLPVMGKRGPVLIDSPSGGGKDMLYTYQNLENVDIDGVTVDGGLTLNDNWDLTFGYTYLNAKDSKTHKRVNFKAKHTINAGINYHNNDGWKASLWGNSLLDYTDEEGRGREAVQVLKDFTTWNFIVSKDVNPNMNVYFGINNIFGAYQENRDVDGQDYRLGMNYKF